jgi:hypothetical protein
MRSQLCLVNGNRAGLFPVPSYGVRRHGAAVASADMAVHATACSRIDKRKMF